MTTKVTVTITRSHKGVMVLIIAPNHRAITVLLCNNFAGYQTNVVVPSLSASNHESVASFTWAMQLAAAYHRRLVRFCEYMNARSDIFIDDENACETCGATVKVQENGLCITCNHEHIDHLDDAIAPTDQ